MYWLLKKKLWAERTPLYTSPIMQRLNFLYDQLVFFENTDSMRVWPIHMSPDEVDAWYELYFEWKLPTAHIKNEEILDYFTDEFSETKKLLSVFYFE